jgi:uncharacterized protein YijF (DUF1287 family)
MRLSQSAGWLLIVWSLLFSAPSPAASVSPSSAPTDSTATGSTTTGSTAIGSTATGSTATGSTGTGSTATGSTSTGSTGTGSTATDSTSTAASRKATGSRAPPSHRSADSPRSRPEGVRLVAAARAQIGKTLRYDPAYQRLAYPRGDVPLDRGVCSDVVIRAFRRLGVDLQVRVHEDMLAHFDAYPSLWKLKAPDPNIDHRRVPNLETYFRRQGMARVASTVAEDYLPGDLVTWRLPGNLPHIGIVSDRRTRDGARPLVLHNIGAGTQEEDVLFAWPPSGHFRCFAPKVGAPPLENAR